MNNYNHNCHHCYSNQPCGCNKPIIKGCNDKTDLLCTEYNSVNLLPLNIQKGDTGELIVKKINDFLKNLIETLEIDPTLIESIGGKVPIYNGLSPAMVHEIKSIQGDPNGGVIVENIQGNQNNCSGSTDYINVRIDEVWLRNYLVENICDIITEAGCGVTPPSNNPVTTNIVKSIVNRGYVNIQSDFASHYSDADGNALASIKITGSSLTGFTFNNVQITSGQTITASQLSSGILKYTGDNVDNSYTKTVDYVAIDSTGAISNTSQIIISVGAKQFVVLNPTTVSLLRGVSNNKNATVSYSNGNGQTLSTGQVLYSAGTAGQSGYLKISVQTATVLNGSGNFNIIVESFPSVNQANQTINYTVDGSTGNVNLVYNSNPSTSDIVINLPYMGSHTFTTSEFINAYTDFDSDNLSEIKAESPVENYLYNGSPYVAGTWIPVNNVDQLTYNAANQIYGYTQSTPWFAKDSQGNIST